MSEPTKMKAKSHPLTTAEHFKVLANQLVGHMTKLNKTRAVQAIEIDQIKEKNAVEIAGQTKVISGLKTRLKNFAEKHGIKLFATKEKPELDTGTLDTNRAKIKVHLNPPSIEKVDKKESDDVLILEAKKQGFGNVIITEEKFSLELMAKLDDGQLKRIGYKRVTDKKTVTIEAQSDPKLKEKETIVSDDQKSA